MRAVPWIVALSIAGACVPPVAGAQSPFPAYRQAAADQYGTPAPQSSPPGGEPATAQGASLSAGVTGAQGAPVRPPAGRTPSRSPRRNSARAPSRRATTGTPAPVPVARQTETQELRGGLPFTGRDLTALVLAGCALLAAGSLVSALARGRSARARG